MYIIIRMTVAERILIDFTTEILCQFTGVQIRQADRYRSRCAIFGLGGGINVIFKILKEQSECVRGIRIFFQRQVGGC